MKRILLLIMTIISIALMYSFIMAIYTLWHKQDLVTQARKQLQVAMQKNASLKKQLTLVNQPQFVEEEARDKLFLVKLGENEVLIEKDLLMGSGSAKPTMQAQTPNWEKWWKLFF